MSLTDEIKEALEKAEENGSYYKTKKVHEWLKQCVQTIESFENESKLHLRDMRQMNEEAKKYFATLIRINEYSRHHAHSGPDLRNAMRYVNHLSSKSLKKEGESE